jgi:competence protein ComEC
MALFLVSAGIASGIIFRSFFIFGLPGIGFFFLLGSLSLFYGLFSRTNFFILFAVIIISFGSGALSMHRVDTALPLSFTGSLGSSIEREGVIVRNPEVRETSTHVVVLIHEEGVPVRILAFSPRERSLAYGDRVLVRGELALPQDFETDSGVLFRYRDYLLARGISFVIFRAEVEVLAQGEGNRLLSSLYHIRALFIEGLTRALPEPHASLGAGITVGAQEGLGAQVSQAFQISGLTHVVVLSGYNLTVVAEAVMRVSQLFLPATVSLVTGGAAIVLFALASGAAPPALRAMLMALIGLFARATGRTYDAFRGLCLAVGIMLLLSPRSLLADPGFQLSVLATLGMIAVAPLIETRLTRIPLRFGIRSLVATTIGVYITVLPLLMYVTGEISTVSLPANIAVLPIIPYAMLATLFASIGGVLFPTPLASIVGFIAYIFLSYMLVIAEILTAFPFASFVVPHFSLVILILFYALFFSFVYRMQQK